MAKYFGLVWLVGLCGLSCVFATVVSSRGLESSETTLLQKSNLVDVQRKERLIVSGTAAAIAVLGLFGYFGRAVEGRSIQTLGYPILLCPLCTTPQRTTADFCFNICSCGYKVCNRNTEECIKSSDGTYLCKSKN